MPGNDGISGSDTAAPDDDGETSFRTGCKNKIPIGVPERTITCVSTSAPSSSMISAITSAAFSTASPSSSSVSRSSEVSVTVSPSTLTVVPDVSAIALPSPSIKPAAAGKITRRNHLRSISVAIPGSVVSGSKTTASTRYVSPSLTAVLNSITRYSSSLVNVPNILAPASGPVTNSANTGPSTSEFASVKVCAYSIVVAGMI